MREDVMVVNTADLQRFIAGHPFNLIRENSTAILELIASDHFFIARDVAEVSPQYRQIIPYVITRCGDDYFVLTRTSKQTEARLHHKLSLGVGGHINPGHSLLEGLQKELDEEVEVAVRYGLRFEGILNDESTEVGRVHLGAVYVLEAESHDVRVRETEKMTSQWMSRASLAGVREAMESWSQVVFDELIA